MATKIIMPKLGMLMTEGRVVEWLRQDGDTVAKDEPVAMVETEKVTHEIVAGSSGIVHVIAQRDEIRLIGKTIGLILDPGESVPVAEEADGALADTLATPADIERPSAIKAPATQGSEKPAPATPLARRVAKELGVDIGLVTGTASGGRVTEKDVRDFYEAALRPQGTRRASARGMGEYVTLTRRRAIIAQRMLESLQSMAQFTLTRRADATSLVELRQLLSERWNERITFTDIFVSAAALTLRKHPLLNSTLIGEEVRSSDHIDMGVAVALDDGLIVPVVRRADALSILDVHRGLGELVRQAREGTIALDDVSGSTFTISNLGMYGIETFTPIINPPETAVLGVGRIGQGLRWTGRVAIPCEEVTLSLTVDHRVVDGATGAVFLRDLVQLIEHPLLILLKDGATSR